MSTLDIVLVVLAVVIGVLYFMRRSSRKRREAQGRPGGK